jgi:hypothetical protein
MTFLARSAELSGTRIDASARSFHRMTFRVRWRWRLMRSKRCGMVGARLLCLCCSLGGCEADSRVAGRTPRDAGRDARAATLHDAAAVLGDRPDAGARVAPWPATLATPSTPACPSRRLDLHDDDAGADGPTSQPTLSLRPQLGGFSADSMRIWLRAQGAADVCVEYWPHDQPAASKTALGPELRADSDFAGAVPIGGLSSGTRYDYRIWLAEPGGKFIRDKVAANSFETAPKAGASAHVRLV